MPPQPKRKLSTRRKGKRRQAKGLNVPALVTCPHCQQPKRPHQLCPNCHQY